MATSQRGDGCKLQIPIGFRAEAPCLKMTTFQWSVARKKEQLLGTRLLFDPIDNTAYTASLGDANPRNTT